MSYFWIFFVIFWVIIIKFPDFLSYLIGWFFLFVWINIFLTKYLYSRKAKNSENNKDWQSYVKFWNYKIYKD